MHKNLKYSAAGVSAPKPFEPRVVKMDYEGVLTSERMNEIMMMCDRDRPVYGQVSCYSVAFYTLGMGDCPDFMSFQDVSAEDASEILKANFTEVPFIDIPADYHIVESKERYLMVIGDPLFPKHVAVVANLRSSRPYFSKLPLFGTGYDSMDELMDEFAGIAGVSRDDFHFFRKDWYGQIPPSSRGKIYIVKE